MSPTLKDFTTRELLQAARNERAHGHRFDVEHGHAEDTVLVGTRLTKGNVPVAVYCKMQELLDELNTRPHVTGKREAKVLRRLQAQTGQSEEWLRAHPRFGQELVDAQYPNRRPCTPEFARRMAVYYGSAFGKLFKVVP